MLGKWSWDSLQLSVLQQGDISPAPCSHAAPSTVFVPSVQYTFLPAECWVWPQARLPVPQLLVGWTWPRQPHQQFALVLLPPGLQEDCRGVPGRPAQLQAHWEGTGGLRGR